MLLPCDAMVDKDWKIDLSELAYRRHRGDVYRYLLRRTGNRDDAEELTQVVFTEAVRALPKLARPPDSVLGWLYTVAERRFVDEIRRRTARRRRLHLLYRPEAEDPPQYGPLAARAIERAVASLAHDQRRVVVMRLFEDRSFAFIAAELGTTEAACKMQFARGVAQVRKQLAQEGLEP